MDAGGGWNPHPVGVRWKVEASKGPNPVGVRWDLYRNIPGACNGASQAVADYLKHRFTVDLSRLLSRFFASWDEVLDFRRLQANYQFLISGSTALQLLDRTIYPNSDLDLYLFPNDAKAVGRWLIEHGYTFHSSRNAYPKTFVEALNCMPPLKSPSATPLLPRDVTTGSDITLANNHIQLIVTDMSPYEAILRAHSTVVMNVITWNRAIALFPLATLEQRRRVVTHNSGLIYHHWTIYKYEQRGFSFPDPLARFGEHLDRGSFKVGIVSSVTSIRGLSVSIRLESIHQDST
ncbi:hypothetical protein EXIGLDRAFT_768420 [Exidia glandulosa HHB12029]|uniref:Uncharacterized protein n=1 Tax=Exidia glandulosa HHB12029 TaxID=1314781 RepID=A0A165I9K3_EXIGL|nr:hypothetical protein EXIGLDRAFT_768420 [Exidia glandulosa HHB12029]